METFSALLGLCEGNLPVTGEFPSQRLMGRSFDVFVDLRLNKQLSKQSIRWWFETPSHSLWRHDAMEIKQDKSEGFDSCDWPSNLTQNGFKSSIFQPAWPWNFDGWPHKIIGHLFCTISSFVHHFKSISEFKQELQFGSKLRIFVPCDLEIWRMTLKNNMTPLPCHFKLCVSFRSDWWIQTGVTDRKRPIWVKIDNFARRTTLQFDYDLEKQ